MEASRQIIVITGEQADCLRVAKTLSKNIASLILEDPKKANESLGQEFDAIIFCSHNGFSPNAFGAISGTIRGGGTLFLLKPEKWPINSLFLKRFENLLKNSQAVRFITPHKIQDEPLTALPKYKIDQLCATDDQATAVKAIIHVVKGHRRRPLVITSDRGRGKSAALGIAAKQLFQEGLKKIIVCAPSKKTAAIIYKHASDAEIQFYSPDELQQQKPKADLLLIDEAAAIPVPLLTQFLKDYSRLVFATTQHGYEGSGRGFAINFKKVLDQLAPNWNTCQLKQPIRWQQNDPLEQFIFKALLLNAEAAELVNQVELVNCTFTTINKPELINNDKQLSELFGLLVSAHYQTKPSDFMQMLDDDSIHIFCILQEQHIIAVALVAQEGQIDSATCQQIFEGNRRLKGHLVAQALAANAGCETAPCLSGERIMRIAVHPKLQGQGVGTLLLDHISQQSQADYLSTSYGATTNLLKFWQRSAYQPVYLSMKRDASSGTHSVIMLLARTEKGKVLQQQARQQFKLNFPHLLSDPFRHLDAGIALSLLQPSETTPLDQHETIIINAFANAQRGYENSLYPIWKLACQKLVNHQQLSPAEQKIILLKVFQKHDWKSLVKQMKAEVNGKKEALQLMRIAVSKL